MTTRIVLNQNQLAQFLTGPQSEAVSRVRDAQRRTLNSARKRAPVDTGHLRLHHRQSNISVEGGKIRGSVEATPSYAAAVHEGYGPRIIRAKNAKFMTWKSGGERVFAKSVRHPGAKARPWLLNAAKAEAGRLGFTLHT